MKETQLPRENLASTLGNLRSCRVKVTGTDPRLWYNAYLHREFKLARLDPMEQIYWVYTEDEYNTVNFIHHEHSTLVFYGKE